MSMRAGALLWNRQRITLAVGAGAPNLVDTGLFETNRSFDGNDPRLPTAAQSINEPSRVMVIPQMPYALWAPITHGEPFISANMDGSTTVKVQFTNGSGAPLVDVNVLFWDPHSLVGPGTAYNPITKVVPDNTRGGAQLWARMQVTITSDGEDPNNEIDTGVWQPIRSFENDSVSEPGMPEVGASPLLPSRLQVIPLSPILEWNGITHGEPFAVVNPDGNTTMHVLFANSNEGNATFNVLFWDPHSLIGPGKADLYEAPIG